MGFGSAHAAQETKTPDGVTTSVVLQYWASADQISDLAEVFEQYQRDNPGVKVVTGQSAARNIVDDPQRVLCAIVGGDPPDIIVFDRYAIGEWAARGAFQPLDEFLRADAARADGLQPEDYYAPCWDEAAYQGHIYGIPMLADNRALYYNRDMLLRHKAELILAGVADEHGEVRPPRSWAELRLAASILSEYDGKPSLAAPRRLKVAGFVPNYGNSWLYLYGWQNGAHFMSADGRTCLLNEPRVVQALTFMKSIYDDLGGASNVYAFQSSFQGGENDPFLQEQIAMKIDGNWTLNGIAAYKADLNFGVVPAPMADPAETPLSWLGGFAWVIPTGAKHPREAWALIRTLASVETALRVVDLQRRREASQGRPYLPPLNANRKITELLFKKYLKDDPRADPKFVRAMQVFIDLLPHSKYRPVTPVGQLLWNQQIQAMENAIFAPPGSGVTPQSALDAGTAVVQRELDRVLRPETGRVIQWSEIVLAYLALLLLGAGLVLAWFFTRFKGGLQARQEAWAGWLFALPWIIGFLVFTGGPILCALLMSACSFDALAPSHWVGARNFKELFTEDPLFWKSLWNTAYMLLGLPLGMALGLGVALLLDARVKGLAVYRTLFYLPAIVPGVASALLWLLIFNPNTGVLNWALGLLGVQGPNWLEDENWAKPALILQGLWGAGAGMLVWLAGLKAIPVELYEAAAVDGAGPLRRFWHITLPILTPYIFFTLVMGLIGTFQIFTPAYLMTAGGPVNATLFYAYYLFNQAFRYLHMGYASALAWILFLLVFSLTLWQTRMARHWVHYLGD